MKAPESISWAIHDTHVGDRYFNCSYLQFYCGETQREEAARCFQDAFDSVRREVALSYRDEGETDDVDEAVSRYGWCSTSLNSDGFIATFGVLYDIDGVGWMHIGLRLGGVDPVSKAIAAVTQSFPSIRYQGVEHYIYQNRWGGEVRYEDYSKGAEVPLINELLGEQLYFALGDEDAFWSEQEESLYDEKDFAEVLEFFQIYAAYIREDTVEKLLNLAKKRDPVIREALEGESFDSSATPSRQSGTISYRQPSPKPAAMLQLHEGDMVKHSLFGSGIVLSVQPMGGDALVKVAFDNVGTKALMLKAASKFMTKESY